MSVWTIHDMHDVLFGVDSRLQLGEKLKGYGATKVLLFHDEVMGPLGYVDELVKIIKDAGMDVVTYKGAPGEPNSDNVDKVVEFARAEKIDAMVGLGGGAAMDTTKLAGKVIANGGKTTDYLGGYTAIAAGSKKFSPMILLPTTSGTGSEVSYGLMCQNNDNGVKTFALHPATLAIIDPTYTFKLPPAVTAFTGIDAFCHCAECLCNSVAMPNYLADAIAREGMRLSFKYLPKVFDNPDDVEARTMMSAAAMLGGQAITLRKTSIGHAVSNQLSDNYHTPHGIGTSVGIDVQARYNVKGDPGTTRIWAECMGIACPEDADMEAVGNEVVAKLEALLKKVGLKNMKQMDIPESFCDMIADNVAKDKKWAIVPNPPDFDLLRKVIKESYDY